MRNKVSSITLLSAILSILAPVAATGAFSGAGSGTEQDPYIITNVQQLQEMNDDLDAWYELGEDIDASDTKNWNGGTGFIPIGDSTPFTGHFDGQGRTITGLFINRGGRVGLFGRIDLGADIRNVGLVAVDVSGSGESGGLVVFNNHGSVSNSYCTGSVSSSSIGGNGVGGLVGFNIGEITASYFSGNVTGGFSVGGLVGQNYGDGGNISRCYSAGNVQVTSSLNAIGGLVGANGGSITDSYSEANVSGGRFIGGLVGSVGAWAGPIVNCYSVGSVSSPVAIYKGGFIGISWGTPFNNCFWDIQTSGQETSGGALGKTTAEMKQQATFVGWDFVNVWDIQEGVSYPFLRGVGPPESPQPPEPPLHAQLAITVIGADYLWGGKGFCYSKMAFLEAEDIFDEYTYWNEVKWDNDTGKGLDCAGLIFWAYNKAYGAESFKTCSEPHNPIHYEGADGQYWENSEPIEPQELKPGDLLFFDWDGDGERDHVEMYVGDYDYEGGIIRGLEYPTGTYDIVAARGDDTHNYGIVPDRVSSRSLVPGFVGFSRVIEPLVDGTVCTGSPVDLAVTDPDGLTVNNQICEVPHTLYYSVCDLDKDGENDDIVTISVMKNGDYRISVIAESSASPTDTYDLRVAASGEIIVLAENVTIEEIPAQPYIIRSTGTEIIPIIPATIDFNPDTLNLKSEGEWITVYIELPTGHGYDVSDINVGRTFLEGLLEAQHSDIQDGVLMVKFDMQDLIIFLESVIGVIPPEEIPITVTGELKDGRPFEGSDTIRVIERGET